MVIFKVHIFFPTHAINSNLVQSLFCFLSVGLNKNCVKFKGFGTLQLPLHSTEIALRSSKISGVKPEISFDLHYYFNCPMNFTQTKFMNVSQTYILSA